MRIGKITIALIVVSLASGLTGYRVETMEWVKPATSSGPSVDRAGSLQKQINALAKGGALDLVTLRMPSGKETTVSIIEGQFESTAITPAETWKARGWRNAMLVNSVDQAQSASGGMSGAVINGCGLPNQGASLPRGGVEIHACAKGAPYRSLGIKSVANMAVVTFAQAMGSDPCKGNLREESQCVKESVDRGLQNLFRQLRTLPPSERPEVLVIPAIGTGTGGMDKTNYYPILTRVLLFERDFPNGFLPPRIYLHEWNDPRNGYANASYSISNEVPALEDAWLPKGPQASGSLFLIFSGSCVALVIFQAIYSSSGSGASARVLDIEVSPLLTVGWLVASIAAGAGMKDVMSSLSAIMPSLKSWPVMILAGACGVVLAFILVAADRAFRDGKDTSTRTD